MSDGRVNIQIQGPASIRKELKSVARLTGKTLAEVGVEFLQEGIRSHPLAGLPDDHGGIDPEKLASGDDA